MQFELSRSDIARTRYAQVQHILNCAGDMAGSCYGGSHTGAYQWIHEVGTAARTSGSPRWPGVPSHRAGLE